MAAIGSNFKRKMVAGLISWTGSSKIARLKVVQNHKSYLPKLGACI